MTTCNRALFCLLLFHHFSLICIPPRLTSDLLCCTNWLATRELARQCLLPSEITGRFPLHRIVTPPIVVTRVQGESPLLDCLSKLRPMGTASVEDMMSGGVDYSHKYLSSAPQSSLHIDMGSTDHRPPLEDLD